MGDNIISSQPKELDEDDEVLSFCDIPIYSDASADSTFTTSSSEEEGLFEFFRSGFPNSRFQPDNFIFCGRFIPYGESPASHKKAGRGSRVSSMKSCKWYKIIFGSMRLSSVMELDDIKNRQRRHRKPKAMLKMYVNDERSNLGRRSSSNGLMGLVRSLSCKGLCSTSIMDM